MRERLFHRNYPDGKLCLTQAEVDACRAEGAVDAKWKVIGIVPDDLKGQIKEDIIAKPMPQETDGKRYCECGCGQEVKNRFVQGHSFRRKKDGDSPKHKPAD